MRSHLPGEGRGSKFDRPEFAAMLDYVREDDTVMMNKLDLIGR
ncbi:MAG TPA: hypothetical protein PLI53_10015 [Geobacteraceae bacterium]|nr:hypothetical protein [Geobacteraceae bacterium]